MCRDRIYPIMGNLVSIIHQIPPQKAIMYVRVIRIIQIIWMLYSVYNIPMATQDITERPGSTKFSVTIIIENYVCKDIGNSN